MDLAAGRVGLDFADFFLLDPGHPVIEKARSLQEKKKQYERVPTKQQMRDRSFQLARIPTLWE